MNVSRFDGVYALPVNEYVSVLALVNLDLCRFFFGRELLCVVFSLAVTYSVSFSSGRELLCVVSCVCLAGLLCRLGCFPLYNLCRSWLR